MNFINSVRKLCLLMLIVLLMLQSPQIHQKPLNQFVKLKLGWTRKFHIFTTAVYQAVDLFDF